MICQVCGSFSRRFLDLGMTEACNFQPEKYPLGLAHCSHCDLIQVTDPVDREILFPAEGYHHLAGYSGSFRRHLEDLAAEVCEGLKPGSFVVELGSNDGVLLEAFRTCGMKVLGVDPADVGYDAEDVSVVREFFDHRIAARIVEQYGHADVVVACNTFAHMDHIHSVMEGIHYLLKEDGVLVLENHDATKITVEEQYDFVYHEHYRYYTERSLEYLLNMHGFEVWSHEEFPTHGGSIRTVAKKQGVVDAYTMQDRVNAHRTALRAFLESHRCAGLTFPARAVTMLQDMPLKYITESSERKIGKSFQGIPIVDQKILFGDDQPEYGLLLSYHLPELMDIFREKGFKGKFVHPLTLEEM